MIYALGERVPVLEGAGHYVAENATVIGSVILKERASIWFNAVVRGDNDTIEIGSRSNVQDGAVLHTDSGIRLEVGAGVTVGHQAMLHGCTIGDHSLVGIGAIIMNHATIGKHSIVAANALVTEKKSFPDGVLIVGSPAGISRELSDDERGYIAQAAARYVAKASTYPLELAHFKGA